MTTEGKLILEIPDYSVIEFFPKKSRFCVCIPVINEGSRIKAQLSRMQMLANEIDIIIADGGSTDGSIDPDLLRTSGVQTLLIKTGPGKLSAQLRMAYHYAIIKRRYEGVITIDGNNKDGVEAIPLFIKKLDEGYDFIQGSRFLQGGAAINTPLIRLLSIKLVHIPVICFLSGFRYTDTTNGFRAYSKRVILDSRIQIFRNIFSTYELLAFLSVKIPQVGYKTIEIPVIRQYPAAGNTPTKLSFVKGNFTILKILFFLILGKYDAKHR
jgi:dolichol-phosphate mannosyltransferase